MSDNVRQQGVTKADRAVLVITVWFSCLLSPLAAQTARPLKQFDQVAISPDGTKLAWVENGLNSEGDPATPTAIYIQDVGGAEAPRRMVANGMSTASADTVAWSSDRQHLAFFSNAYDGTQLYVADVGEGKGRRLTDLSGYIAEPKWSPDGKHIALLFTENASRSGGPLMPMAPETGVIDAKVYEQRIALIDVASQEFLLISPADMYAYEYDWAPDSKNIVFTGAHGAGDANWYVARLYTINIENRKLKELVKPPLQIADPRWSPDGKNIAFIAGLMSDEGFTGGDIFIVPAKGGGVRNITPDIPASPASIHWIGPNTIVFAEHIDGQYGVSSLDVGSGQIAQPWIAAESISSTSSSLPDISLSANGKQSAVIRQSSTHPPEIWVGPIGDWKQVTQANDSARPTWGEQKSLHWMNGDTRVQGWLMYPSDYDPKKRYPMIVWVHGGPAGTERLGWPGVFINTYEFSNRGYFVFYPNPRGSYGEGEKFTQANVKDFGYGDFQDILTGVDEVVKTFPVDNDRIGISGWSYGGYMTMWAVTQTSRFRAAVAGAGIADWESYYGENDIDEWMIPYFGASVYDDPAVYARSAPITFIKNAKTPTLVMVGERDGECPAPQSREFWHALQALGVPTELVIYQGEGHAFLQPDNRRDAMNRLIQWFDRYLKPKS